MVKIGDIYYAILGQKSTENGSEYENSNSIDTFNYDSGQWTLTYGLDYDIGQNWAIEFRNIIYAAGANNNTIV